MLIISQRFCKHTNLLLLQLSTNASWDKKRFWILFSFFLLGLKRSTGNIITTLPSPYSWIVSDYSDTCLEISDKAHETSTICVSLFILWAHQTPSLCDTGDTIDCPAQNCPLLVGKVGNSECINDQEGLSIYGNPETTTYNSAILATATCVKSFLSSTKKASTDQKIYFNTLTQEVGYRQWCGQLQGLYALLLLSGQSEQT